MNKEIIIDGVDVSGCEHLYREIDCLAHIDFSECCEGYNHSYGYCPNIDCYYKQLKRKEQECEELKEKLEAVYDDCKGCSTCNEALYNANLYAKEYRKLKQTLTEIKEIAEAITNGTHFSDDIETHLKEMVNKIIEKINEVEDVSSNSK